MLKNDDNSLVTSKVNKVEHLPPFFGVICSFDFISWMSSREEALILSEKKRLVHVLWYYILGWKLSKQTSYWSKTGFFFSVKKVNNIFIPNYRDIIPKYHTKMSYKRTWTSLKSWIFDKCATWNSYPEWHMFYIVFASRLYIKEHS